MSDIRQNILYAKYMAKTGWHVEKIGNTFVYIKKLPLSFSFIKLQRPKILDKRTLEELNLLGKKHRAIQISIEPGSQFDEELLKNFRYKKSKSPYLPTKSLQINLRKEIDDLFRQLKKDTRYSLKKSKGLKIYSVDQTYKFYKSWKQAVGFTRFVTPIKNLNALSETFQDNCLFLITPGGSSGAIFLNTGKTAYYWQAFTDKEGRKEYAQYKILWSAILWAKNKGAKIFDMEGIYDKRFPNKSWLGFSHFKKSFGGQEVTYPEAFVKWVLPFQSS